MMIKLCQKLDVHSTETINLQQVLYPSCLLTGSQSTHQRSESSPFSECENTTSALFNVLIFHACYK